MYPRALQLGKTYARGGRDTVDHPPAGHDDVINSVAGALHMVLSGDNEPLFIPPEALARAKETLNKVGIADHLPPSA